MSYIHWNRIKHFEQYIAVDWSGAKSPIKNHSISVASCDGHHVALEDGPWSRADVASLIVSLAQKGKLTYVGIDANFSHDIKTLEEFCGKNAQAKDLWQKVEDTCADNNNFFAGSFFNHPDYKHLYWQEGKMPSDFEQRRRQTELESIEKEAGIPECTLKLIGAKQVGKGGLAVMRLAYYLKNILGDQICIWPFEEPTKNTVIILSEIFPRIFIKEIGLGNLKIRDKNILKENIPVKLNIGKKSFSDHDTDALISAYGLFNHIAHKKYFEHTEKIPDAAKREGWIFGV